METLPEQGGLSAQGRGGHMTSPAGGQAIELQGMFQNPRATVSRKEGWKEREVNLAILAISGEREQT